jgi:hypothetical protein
VCEALGGAFGQSLGFRFARDADVFGKNIRRRRKALADFVEMRRIRTHGFFSL